jgi:DNA adenine methylase
MIYTKSPIKWVGGKKWLLKALPNLKEVIGGDMLYEPFAGSAALTFALANKNSWLNDNLWPLINFYNALRFSGRSGIVGQHILNHLCHHGSTEEDWYYSQRDKFNTLILQIDKKGWGFREPNLPAAKLFFFLNRTGYGGLYRCNQMGHYNVPYGHYKSPKFPDLEKASVILSHTVLTAFDYVETCPDINHFTFADPPYYNGYDCYDGKNHFNIDRQTEVADWIHELPGRALLMNSLEMKGLYDSMGMDVAVLKTSNRIGNSKPLSSRVRYELIAGHRIKLAEFGL